MPDYEKIAEGVVVPGTEVPEKLITADSAPVRDRDWYSVNHPRHQGLASDKGYDQSYGRIRKTRYSHEAMIDVIIAEPTITQNELAKRFDRSVPWISRIIGSDAFQAALAKRREEITDPFLIATMEERFNGLARQSLDIIAQKLETSQNTDLALKALDISAKALGFGARTAGNNNVNQFVIQLPTKAQSSDEWASEHGQVKRIANGS